MENQGNSDDTIMVEACIRGDLAAWSSLVKKYSSLIRTSIENRLKRYGMRIPPEDIEDIRQNTLGSIWRDKKFNEVRNRRNVACWLAVVSGNMAVEYLRKMKRSDPVPVISLDDKIGEKAIADIIPARTALPCDEISMRSLIEKIETAMEELPHKERLIAKLYLFYGKKYREIEGMLDMPHGTVSSYLTRAKEKLRTELDNFR